jgi:hypothetical protein
MSGVWFGSIECKIALIRKGPPKTSMIQTYIPKDASPTPAISVEAESNTKDVG